MINGDLMRSYKQYIKQQEIEYLKIRLVHKILLAILFFFLLPLSILKIFYIKNKPNVKLYIFPFGDKEPMQSILKEFKKFNSSIVIIYPTSFYIVPSLIIRDFFETLLSHPIWVVKNLDFFGALSLKVSKYYGYKVSYGVSKLLLFQEYSFYSSYLTRVFENEDGSVYNLMHGIPGQESSYFRFTKCFVWGTYFKNFYIDNNADSTQFIVIGSIFHYNIKNNLSKKVDIDILYTMQGTVLEIESVLEVLENISENKIVRYLQHPRYPVNMKDSKLVESHDDILLAISRSKVIVSHYSTTLLDAMSMKKNVISYLSRDSNHRQYIAYMNKNSIVDSEEEFFRLLQKKS
jgi:hypothetical protein